MTATYLIKRFPYKIYQSARGDFMADRDGKAIIATAREIRMNGGDRQKRLWDIRSEHAIHSVASHLSSGDWVEVARK